MTLRSRALQMAAGRAGIGVMSIATPSLSAKIVGYPAAHDNPTARMMARLFGVRELLLAYLVIDAVRGPDGPSPSVFAVQAAVDASDIIVQSWPLIKREGLDRAAVGGVALAGVAALAWARLAREAAAQA